MIELWAGQIAAMSTTQMLALIALAINIVGQFIRYMEAQGNA